MWTKAAIFLLQNKAYKMLCDVIPVFTKADLKWLCNQSERVLYEQISYK